MPLDDEDIETLSANPGPWLPVDWAIGGDSVPPLGGCQGGACPCLTPPVTRAGEPHGG